MTLTLEHKRQIKDWLKICMVRGMAMTSARHLINKQLPADVPRVSIVTLHTYAKQIREESKGWYNSMAADAYAYISELKTRYDVYQEMNKEGWEMYDKAKLDDDIHAMYKGILTIDKANEKLLMIAQILPTIGIPKDGFSDKGTEQIFTTEPEPNNNSTELP